MALEVLSSSLGWAAVATARLTDCLGDSRCWRRLTSPHCPLTSPLQATTPSTSPCLSWRWATATAVRMLRCAVVCSGPPLLPGLVTRGRAEERCVRHPANAQT